MQKLQWLVFVLPFAACCACAPAVEAQDLTALKAKVMAADYRGDLEELARQRDEAAKLTGDRELGYLAHYWSGFASWRLAMNGANHEMKQEDLTANLKNAASSFYAAIRLKNDFADAYSAAAGVNGWLAAFSLGANPDIPSAKERISLFEVLIARAMELEPENPRVLWIHATPLMFKPADRGGNIAAAIEVYRHMLAAAEKATVAPSPFPDWGRPEALMSLAFAHSKQTPPDLKAALEEARAALALQPEWAYVRDSLRPKIEEQMRAAGVQ